QCPASLRTVIETSGGYPAVNGEKLAMRPGDLVLTPSWMWHDHANDSDAPMIWLDGLDSGLIRMLEATFFETCPHESQPVRDELSVSPWRYPTSRHGRRWTSRPHRVTSIPSMA